MKKITKEDVLALREELLQYAEKAEQHEYPRILLKHMFLECAIAHFEELSMKELNTIFRCVCRLIGKDYSEYKETTENKKEK